MTFFILRRKCLLIAFIGWMFLPLNELRAASMSENQVEWNCGSHHDVTFSLHETQLFYEKDKLDGEKKYSRNMEQSQETDRNALRITQDISMLNSSAKNTTELKFIVDALNIASFFFSELIIPRNPTQQPILPPSSHACGYSFSLQQLSQGVESDFHVYVLGTESTGKWIAASTACQLQLIDNRPISGIVTVNLSYISQYLDVTSPFDFSAYVNVLIHEIFHSLAFSPVLFRKFIVLESSTVSSTTTNESGTSQQQFYPESYYNTDPEYGNLFVKFPNVVNWAREHFNCSQIDSVPLENGGSSGSQGSHWERTVFGYDIMTASALSGPQAWSGVNNALILDSGWYLLNEKQQNEQSRPIEDVFLWGKDKGCEFFGSLCKKDSGDGTAVVVFPEYCTQTGKYLNAFDSAGQGFCDSTDGFSSCKYVTVPKNSICAKTSNKYDKISGGAFLFMHYFAEYGDSTRSFLSTLKPTYLEAKYLIEEISTSYSNNSGTSGIISILSAEAICYAYECANNNQSLTIIVGGEIRVTCSRDGEIIKNISPSLTGKLTCPRDIRSFCESAIDCPNQCNQNGYCLRGKCTCFREIEGQDSRTCACRPGMFNQNGACVSCDVMNCSVCGNQVGLCEQCANGFFKWEQMCLPCEMNCFECADFTGACVKCRINYELDSQSIMCVPTQFYINLTKSQDILSMTKILTFTVFLWLTIF